MAGQMLVVGARVVVLAMILATCAVAGTPPPGSDVQESLQLLDVPYVPQSGALCGGAALAMVLRYWGESAVLAEDFAALVEPGQRGIRTGTLTNAVTARGWVSLILPGTPTGVTDELLRGRPVIALLQIGSDAYHYVVVVAWANGWVLVHDPYTGPFRALPAAEFLTAWAGGGYWALLVLPPAATDRHDTADPTPTDPESPDSLTPCDTLIQQGLRLAAAGDVEGAEDAFLAAESLCPASAVPLRERAGLRFRARDWAGASRLSARALDLDPGDAHARRLLAGSRFLAGDVAGALDAWNQLSCPRADLTRIDGLVRIRYAVVARQLDLTPGRLITPGSYRRARRRLAEVPALTDFRLDLRPLPGGVAQVDVAALERPQMAAGGWDLVRAGGRALIEREVAVDVASPTGNGELWTAAWRWWRNRPRVALALAVPAAGGRPGLWRVEGFWERQTYVARAPGGAAATADGTLSREERRRTSLSFADWLGPDLRLEVGAALDRWAGRGDHLALAGAVETRWAHDHLTATVAAARWTSLSDGAPFSAADAILSWRSGEPAAGAPWLGCVGLSSASVDAPLALWSGAGTGYGREPLLRAHPLLVGGVVRGQVFGRTLAHASLETELRRWHRGPLELGWAVFVDTARAWGTGRVGRVPWQVDGGMGLRVRCLGLKGLFRLDMAHGFSDGNEAVSVGWLVP
jgi:hypothetical protein